MKIGFVLAATDHGPMIVNRFDQRIIDGQGVGVGLQLLETGGFDIDAVNASVALLNKRRVHFGVGVAALDVGANIGVFSLAWGRLMRGWGAVLAFEPQQALFQALCGNIALNNLFPTVTPVFAAVGAAEGDIGVPVLDYMRPASFGSLELRASVDAEPIGQPVDYSRTYDVPLTAIDGFDLPRVDLLKVDVEGMELEVLRGAEATIRRCRPVIMVEHIKVGVEPLSLLLRGLGYGEPVPFGMDLLAVHPDDPTREILGA